ncbi:uncharacterized protein LOC124534151 [Vanessa cardui]|uniref:uncharacterized protein LOC124534151 n=1 Tax=Vanessa cardui TaxID=171605 RepID=UPI001F1301B3|nr:uncharacterized protein LOC124534151 [Vanessa cardui]
METFEWENGLLRGKLAYVGSHPTITNEMALIDVFKAFQKEWQAHRKSFENALLLTLKDNFGHRSMNVYVRRSTDALCISNGFYSNDNIVHLLLLEMTLTALPNLMMPEVSFALASNVLRVEAGLSRMIVLSDYLVFRNESDIQNTNDQDTHQSSPFAFKGVDNEGRLAIVADDCTLVGYTLAKLSGQSVTLGHDTFQVRDCKFSVEISPLQYTYGKVPVIAQYFSKSQGKQLEILLTKPIREELMPKLQAAIFSYINTSLVFGDRLEKFREYQDDVFKMVLKNMTELVRNLNNVTIHLNEETADLEPVEISRTYSYNRKSRSDRIVLHSITLHGLDTLYSSHTGGPFKLQSPLIAEAFRFNSITVKGSLFFENNTVKGEHEFAAEIMDTTVNVEIDLETFEPIFKVFYWRKMELSVAELERNLKDRKTASAFVNGYLTNKLPEVLKEHLSNTFVQYKNSNVPLNSVQKMSDVNVHCQSGAPAPNGFGYPVFLGWYG